MSIPDQSHIDRIRDALWSRSGGGASVMVGSGFSRCAIKVKPTATDLPLLDDLEREMTQRLYPSPHHTGSSHQMTTKLGRLDILSLSQEYSTAFGRTELHNFLQQQIRDHDFSPGELHAQLLRLPWRDVFTTNWDTLLERTRLKVGGSAYNAVHNMDQIPLAKKPRIIKLHGSLPSQFPLILTEEDYRTYPGRFAPFVNTVQQAMMETVFLLIGFSGNDPNFLHWSGWVRDNLGSSAPRIYLAGWLDLSSSRRRMLEDRGVVPIDVARHPKALDWPEHQCHRNAIEWVLHSLEKGRPYDLRDWPAPPIESSTPTPEALHPVSDVKSEEPSKEPVAERQMNANEIKDRVSEALRIWSHNRRIYPGWLLLPAGQPWHSMKASTDSWEGPILSQCSDFAPVERLLAIHELIWRREILLEPISQVLEEAAEQALSAVDCHSRRIEGNDVDDIDWTEIREAWRNIALALVTAARHNFSYERFSDRVRKADAFISDDPDVFHRLEHERCLWAVSSMELDRLESLLANWDVVDCDPAWMLRKSALLRDIDRDEEAEQMVELAINGIEQINDDDRSVAGASREGWALWSEARQDNRQALHKRWNELAHVKCDAFTEKDIIERGLTSETESSEKPSFDLGRQQVLRMQFQQKPLVDTTFRVLRLVEVAGLPLNVLGPHAARTAVASQALKSVAAILATTDLEMSIRIVLRVCTYDDDETLAFVLSRTRIASLSSVSASRLVRTCLQLIDYELNRAGIAGEYLERASVERLRVAIEVLSRLALRVEASMAESALDTGLRCHRIPRVASHQWLSKPIDRLIRRSWDSLPKDRRKSLSLDLLAEPILGTGDGSVESSDQLPDPGSLVQSEDLPRSRTSTEDAQWQEIVGQLVIALRASRGPRVRASLRLIPLTRCGQLKEGEASAIAEALWDEEHTDSTGLPADTALLDWAFLLLPEPVSGQAEQRFRNKWLSREHQSSVADITIREVGIAIGRLRAYEAPLKLSNVEQNLLFDVIEQWAEAPVAPPSTDFFQHMQRFAQHVNIGPIEHTLEGLAVLIADLPIPAELGVKIFTKARSLTAIGDPGFEVVGGIARALPGKVSELSRWIRVGLVADVPALNRSAISGLYSWLRALRDPLSPIPSPPEDLVREVGLIVASRRGVSLSEAIDFTRWLFDEGTSDQQEMVSSFCLQGLGYLAEELRYERHEDRFDVPLLRLRSAELAQSMANKGFAEEPAIARWLAVAKVDPLPEVRFAVAR